MSPESARPAHGRRVDAGVPLVRSLASGPGVALGERLDHAEHVVDAVLVAVAELAHRLVQRAAQRPAQRLVGTRLELAGAPAARTAAERSALSSTVLPTPRSPVSTSERSGRPLDHPLEHDVEGAELLVAAGELGRALAGAGGVGVPDRVHDRTVSAYLAGFPRLSRACRVTAVVPSAGLGPSRDRWRGARDGVRRVEPAPAAWRSASGTSSTASRNEPGADVVAPQRQRRPGRRRGARRPQRAVPAAGVEEDRPRRRAAVGRGPCSILPRDPVKGCHGST